MSQPAKYSRSPIGSFRALSIKSTEAKNIVNKASHDFEEILDRPLHEFSLIYKHQILKTAFDELDLLSPQEEVQQKLKVICKILRLDIEGQSSLLENPEIVYCISQKYLNGSNDVEVQNPKKGVDLLKKAVDLDFPIAINDLAFLHLNGIHVQKDFNLAVSLMERAAQLGDPAACANLGAIYRTDDYEHQNIEEAINWLDKGAKLNDISCMQTLGFIFFLGEKAPGEDSNLEKAATYYEKGCELGDDICTYNLGYLYEQHLEKFHKTIIDVEKLYRKASQKNCAPAWLLLANLYETNQIAGGTEKYFECHFKAAELGHVDAIEFLQELKKNIITHIMLLEGIEEVNKDEYIQNLNKLFNSAQNGNNEDLKLIVKYYDKMNLIS